MKQKTDFQTFISYFKPHRRLFFLDLACALMISLIDLFHLSLDGVCIHYYQIVFIRHSGWL